MRLILSIVCVLVVFCAPAESKKPKRHQRSSASVATLKHEEDVDPAKTPFRIDNAAQTAKAKAQLDELMNSREIPVTSLSNQDDDREDPNRRR
jgi:hypothetical protein